MPYNAIYYPWIEPQNRGTLASAMLYWDRVFTIVPAHMGLRYESQDARVANDLGFLRQREVSYDSVEVTAASDEFLDDLDRRAIQREIGRLRQNPATWATGWSRIHIEKMSRPLRDALAHRRQPDHHGFVEVDPAMASAYMARLAATVARRDEAAPYTDRSTSHRVVVDRYAEVGPRQTARAAEAALAVLSFSRIGISPGVPLGEIWAFRETHADELARYRQSLRRLTRPIPRDLSSQELQHECTGILRDDVWPATDELRTKLRECGIDSVLAALEVVMLCGAALLGSGLSPTMWTAALAPLAVRTTFLACRSRIARNRISHSPFAYLARARMAFEGGLVQ